MPVSKWQHHGICGCSWTTGWAQGKLNTCSQEGMFCCWFLSSREVLVWNISASAMLLNIITVFQLLRHARVLTVANFASCDYFSYLSRKVWTNLLQCPLQWYCQFCSEDRRVMLWIINVLPTLKYRAFECSKTFLSLMFGTLKKKTFSNS